MLANTVFSSDMLRVEIVSRENCTVPGGETTSWDILWSRPWTSSWATQQTLPAKQWDFKPGQSSPGLTWIVLQSSPAIQLLSVFLMAELHVEQRRQQGGLGMLQSDGEGWELHQMVLFHCRVDLCWLGELGAEGWLWWWKFLLVFMMKTLRLLFTKVEDDDETENNVGDPTWYLHPQCFPVLHWARELPSLLYSWLAGSLPRMRRPTSLSFIETFWSIISHTLTEERGG